MALHQLDKTTKGTKYLYAAFFIAGVAASYIAITLMGYNTAHSMLQAPLNVTNIASAFNLVGNAYFNKLGYSVIGDAKFGNIPNSGAGNLYGFSAIDVVGDAALSGTITAFIFQNQSLPASEFKNGSIVSSFYTYESTSSALQLASTTYNGVTVRAYEVNTTLASSLQPSNAITYYQYGTVFRYNNALFFCSDSSLTLCYSASKYLISLISKL